jgi:hypothetical protein
MRAPKNKNTMKVLDKPPAKRIKKEKKPALNPLLDHTFNLVPIVSKSKTALPDPYPDLDDKTRAYLGLFPYGQNIIVSKSSLNKLQNFYLDIRDIPLPHTLINHFSEQLNLLRNVLGLISIEDWEAKQLADVPSYKSHKKYRCLCKKPK